MDIKIGDFLKISTQNKKNFLEIETFKHLNGDVIKVSTYWRSCAFDIKISSNEEAICLSNYLSQDAIGHTNLNEFSSCEFDESYDEYERNIDVNLRSNNKYGEKEIYKKALDNGIDWILNNEFYSNSVEYRLTLPLKII
tara:strand:+ start:562 stop:978 length:417 start_codon:yes stop_codon:yes gene_type:complete